MDLPRWASEMISKYRAAIAHVFLLHGNVGDYQVGSALMLRELLAKIWPKRKVIVYYNRSEGITFLTPGMKEEFMRVMGLDQQANDPVMAALQGATGGEVALPAAPSQALPLLEKFLRLRQEDEEGERPYPGMVVIDYLEAVAPRGEYGSMGPDDRTAAVTLQRWAVDPDLTAAGNPVILVAKTLADVHQDLRAAGSRVEAIRVPLPSTEERLEFIQFLAEQDDAADLNGFTQETLAAAMAGLSRFEIENIEMRAKWADSPVTRELVRIRKREVTQTEYGDVIEFLEPDYGFEAVGGLDHVKRFLSEEIVEPIQEGRTEDVPMGVAFFGPPGTGKTALMLAAAKESGFNALALNLGKILGPYVGSSESNLEKALGAIDALQPVFVLVDEIDQAGIGRGQSGDSGVGNRLFKRLLEYLGDGGHRGKVVFFFASNRPDLVDAALKRPGRMDAKIPFTVPGDREREEIFKAIGRKHGIVLEVSDWGPAVQRTKGWTGAEIEAALMKARRTSRRNGRAEITAEDLDHALWAISPSTGEIEFQTLLAIKEANDKDLLPPEYRAKETAEIDTRLNELGKTQRRRFRDE